MNLFVALCTIATLCFIRASALEEQDVEDLDLEMDMEFERDLEDYDGDDQDEESEEDYSDPDSGDVKARPSKKPYCVRTFRDGWGGQCLDGSQLPNATCDFIRVGKPSQCPETDKYCCINCYAQKQYENCGKIEFLSSPTRRDCSEGDVVLRTMNSGCNCCGKCKPHKRLCKKSKGRFCVTKNDPVCSIKYCEDAGGRIKSKTCTGKHCFCCIPGNDPIPIPKECV